MIGWYNHLFTFENVVSVIFVDFNIFLNLCVKKRRLALVKNQSINKCSCYLFSTISIQWHSHTAYRLSSLSPVFMCGFMEQLFTFGLRSFIVELAQKLFIIHEVEFISCIQLSPTNDTCETVHVVDILLSPPDNIRWRNMWSTGTTLRPKFSIK